MTAWMIALGAVLLILACVVELRAPEPIIPLQLFRQRTITLATGAGLFIGVAIFGATVFLAQYFQIARGATPTSSGLRTMPMILGLAISSLVVGRLVTSTGRWKRYLVGGSLCATAGFALLGTIDAHTSFVLVAVYMALVGIGLGATMLGGSSSGIPDVHALPAPIAHLVEDSYGSAVGHVFLVAAPLMALAVLAILFIKEVPLRQRSGTELTRDLEQTGAAGEVSGAAIEHVAEGIRRVLFVPFPPPPPVRRQRRREHGC